MAKSKNGGSRAYIRGRLGSDVYTIGKNGLGQKQQVVRSLAESVANPRTSSQMFNRMIMSTVMQAVSNLSFIIDHSFDGVAKGQPSISEFIRQNYALVKADAVAHPSSGNYFGLNKYQEKGIKLGAYVVSNGELASPEYGGFVSEGISLGLDEVGSKVSDLATAMGVAQGGFNTWLFVKNDGSVLFVRVHLLDTVEASTVISAENIGSVVKLESNYGATVTFAEGDVRVSYPDGISVGSSTSVYARILSDRKNGQWIHNRATLYGASGFNFNADAALPTYPIGTEEFLNGGDL